MSEIDDVKQRLNIVDIIGERVNLKKAGRHFKACCPFHSEKTPSFMVSPERQSFYCFGCHKGGSVIDFVMEYEHVDFSEALETLAARAGVTLTKRAGQGEEKFRTQLYEANAAVSDYYHYLLTKHALGEKALLYLKHRGITEKSMKTFGIGYSPNSWDATIKYLKKKGFDERVIEGAGLAIRGNRGLYDRFRGRVMFTLRDHRGRVVGFSGRTLDPTAKEAKYINTNETPIYNKSAVLFGLDVTKDTIAKDRTAVVMEGEVDVISSFQAGVGNVVAIKGSALTEGHVHLLKRFAEKIIFSLDSDLAGDMAARRGIAIADQEGLELKVVVVPNGKDPDEAVRTDPVGFKKAIEAAIPVYDYFITSACKRFDPESAIGKRRISEEVVASLTLIGNPVVQAHYAKKLAAVLDVPPDAVTESIRKYRAPLGMKKSSDKEEKIDEKVKDRQEIIESHLVSILLQGNTYEWASELKASGIADRFMSVPLKRIVARVIEFVREDTPFVIADFAGIIEPELLSILDSVYLTDLTPMIDNEELFYSEWRKTFHELRRTIARKRMKELTDLMRAGETDELTRELTEVTRTLRDLEKDA